MIDALPRLATLRGETFGIGATEGTAGADAAAMVMLALFLFLLTLILLVARGLARRAANPLPEQALIEDLNGWMNGAGNDGQAREPRDPSLSGTVPSAESNGETHAEPAREPWEKPDDWWRRMPQ